jgi:ribosome-associated protein
MASKKPTPANARPASAKTSDAKTAAAKKTAAQLADAKNLADVVANALDDLKGNDVVTLDVRGLSGFTDYMVIASGTSNRHVKSLAERAQERSRELGIKPIGVEGEQMGEWVLVDFGDVVLHVMLPETRKFYDLERLWHTPAAPTPPTPAGQGTH